MARDEANAAIAMCAHIARTLRRVEEDVGRVADGLAELRVSSVTSTISEKVARIKGLEYVLSHQRELLASLRGRVEELGYRCGPRAARGRS